MDKNNLNLNCTFWNNTSSSASSLPFSFFHPSSSSSNFSSADRLTGSRSLSLQLSSEGSEPDAEAAVLSSVVDSDSYESLRSSPRLVVEELQEVVVPPHHSPPFQWTDQSQTTVSYNEWQQMEDVDNDDKYDINSCPLFNFNTFGNILDFDCDVNSLIPGIPDDKFLFCDGSATALGGDGVTTTGVRTTGAITTGDMTTDFMATGIMATGVVTTDVTTTGVMTTDVMATTGINHSPVQNQNLLIRSTSYYEDQKTNGTDYNNYTNSRQPSFSHAYNRFSVNNVFLSTMSSDHDETLLKNGYDVRTIDRTESEVMKLLLQKRHQWAPPSQKNPIPVIRGSRKRASGSSSSSAKQQNRAKAARSSRLVQSPTERRHSVPSSSTFSSSAETFHVNRRLPASISPPDPQNNNNDASASIQRLLTELMLLDSANDDVMMSAAMMTSSGEEIKTFESNSCDLFFDRCIQTLAMQSDSDLLENLKLESDYGIDGDCDTFQLMKGLEHHVIKSEPEDYKIQDLWNCDYDTSPPQNQDRYNRVEEKMKKHEERKVDYVVAGGGSLLRNKLLQNSKHPLNEIPLAAHLSDLPISDHDYCHSNASLSSRMTAGCSNDAWINKQLTYSRYSCLARNCDYSELKSLLLDSNLSEEVRKEAEVVRAKSRQRMSEKLKPLKIRDSTQFKISRYVKSVEVEEMKMKPLNDADITLPTTKVTSPAMKKDLFKLTSPAVEDLSSETILDGENGVSKTMNNEEQEMTNMLFGVSTDFLCDGISGSMSEDCPEKEQQEVADDIRIEMDDCIASSEGQSSNVLFFDSFEDFFNSNHELHDSDSGNNARNDDNAITVTENNVTGLRLERLPEKNNFSRLVNKYSMLRKISGTAIGRWFRKRRNSAANPARFSARQKSINHQETNVSYSTCHETEVS